MTSSPDITPLAEALAFDSGRVLDVATGTGGFIEALALNLPGYTTITGVDRNQRALASAAAAGRECVQFACADALRLPFAPASFDTVTISNSLHHLEQPGEALREMLRLLAPGGRLVIAEMVCDGQTETQQTHVDLHHWWGAVDRACGVGHFATYPRGELAALAQSLGLANLALYDESDLSGDPFDPELAAELEDIIDRYNRRIPGPEWAALRDEGERLRARLRRVGLHWASRLVAVGTRETF